MPLAPGTTLGSYQVTAKIGEGGMGEVYQARDTKLDRDVALKVLPEAFTSDPDRLARFEREAKVLASLNHPNIGSIYGLEEAEGVKALVLELVEGPTLADRIKQGPIPLDEALPIAKQIAEALEAAHEQGVIHRDLKPANVKVKDDGTVKVLDFGLAKAFQPDTGSDTSESPTMTAAATQQGVILGTAAYMSPEQAKGKTADRRADIWAFGCVLYEMLTGTRPFDGGNVSEVLAEVIKSDPNWEALPDATPARIRQVAQRCLQKDPKQRLHDVADLRLAMDGAFESTASTPSGQVVTPQLQVWQRPAAVALIALCTAAVASLVTWGLSRSTPSVQPITRFVIDMPERELFAGLGRRLLAVSPDGARVAYVADEQIYLRRLDQIEASAVPGTGTEAAGGRFGRSPFFSPDSQWLGYYKDGQLKKVSVSGGAPLTVCEAQIPWGVSWGPDDSILFGQGPEGVWRVSGAGGTPELLFSVGDGEEAHGSQLLPGGEWVLFTLRPSSASDWDDAQVVVQSLTTEQRRVLVEGGRDARYVPTGHLVYGLNGTLLAVPFDVEGPTVTPGPVSLVERVMDAGPLTGAVQFDVSNLGSLVYAPRRGQADSVLGWVDQNGQMTPLWQRDGEFWHPRLSPSGSQVALQIRTDADPQLAARGRDIWIYDIERDTPRKLTVEGFNDVPAWTADGANATFGSIRSGAWDLYSKPVNGSGEAVKLRETPIDSFPGSWSPDGRLVFSERTVMGARRDIWILTGRRQSFLQPSSMSGHRACLPMGSWWPMCPIGLARIRFTYSRFLVVAR